ncbi:MAG: hypothetical protein KGR16_03260 [Verrucomicrobia bacterium]|nr:hypothetical protein [Verrucomicrobiota bacterium]
MTGCVNRGVLDGTVLRDHWMRPKIDDSVPAVFAKYALLCAGTLIARATVWGDVQHHDPLHRQDTIKNIVRVSLYFGLCGVVLHTALSTFIDP